MATIHWLGTGLSAIPGLKQLIINGHQVAVYNRTVAKANEALKDVVGNCEVFEFSLDLLRKQAQAKDVIVSMLPGDFHVDVAKISLDAGAHFVSSSYISDEMRALDDSAKEQGLSLVNEVGLDPGIDHSLAHALVEDYKQSSAFAKDNDHAFLSYCGGLSQVPNDFCYKFSWSPLGVLKALMSPSLSIRNGCNYAITKPWESVESYTLPMPWGEESFEVYPNRDSLPFISQYHLDDGLNISQFVRGTLRYQGWKNAWQGIFSEIDNLSAHNADERLRQISTELWKKYAFAEAEVDRVILTVELKVLRNDKPVWHKQYLMDTCGNDKGSAMATLVSGSVALAVEAVINNEIPAGVSAVPDNSPLVARWLDRAKELSDHFSLVDHLN